MELLDCVAEDFKAGLLTCDEALGMLMESVGSGSIELPSAVVSIIEGVIEHRRWQDERLRKAWQELDGYKEREQERARSGVLESAGIADDDFMRSHFRVVSL